jgi:AraC-like DNA-binding protein
VLTDNRALRRDAGGPRSSRLFAKYFLSYTAILLIPSVFGALLYAVSTGAIEESARKSARAILEQTRDVVDTRVAELDSTSKQIGLSPKALSVLYMDAAPEGSPSHYTIWSAWKELPNYALANTFISSYYIIPRKAGVILSAESVLPNDESDYERVLKYKDWDFERWSSFLFSSVHEHELLPGARLHVDGLDKKGVYFLSSIPIDGSKSAQGAFLIFIDDSSLSSLLRRLDTGKKGLAFISDAEGQIVASVSGERCSIAASEAARLSAKDRAFALEHSGYILSATKSELTGWSYISVLPSSMVLAPVLRARNIALVILGLGLGLGLVAAIAMARRSAEPIYELATRIGGRLGGKRPGEYRDELEFLGDALTDLVEKDEGLRREIEAQLPVLRSDLTRRLLLGLYGSEEEAHALAATAKVELAEKSFAAAAVRIEGYGGGVNAILLDELQIVRAAIKEALHSAMKAEGGGADSAEVFTHEPDEISLALLFIFRSPAAKGAEDRAEAHAEAILERITQRLASGYRVRLTYATNGAASLSELPFAYLRARRGADPTESAAVALAESAEASGESERKDESAFSFALETELRLLATIKGGDEKAIKTIVRQLERENLVERDLSELMFRDFALSLRVALIRGFGATGGRAAEPPPQGGEDRAAWFERQEKLLLELRSLFESSRKKEKSELASSIEGRLAELYADPGLTIFAVAKEFGYSESFFYHLFRECFGQSFADYLEGLRIREACARLAGEKAMIKDIGASVGFASDTTFRRAFHRVMGLSPSEYLCAVSKAAKGTKPGAEQKTTASREKRSLPDSEYRA